MKLTTVDLPFYIGCPVWNCDHWGGQVYPTGTGRREWLSWYSRTFNTVEGNSTFYGLPSLETVHRWGQEAAAGFRFALKFPRRITHELRLQDCASEVNHFLEVLRVLKNHQVLGPTFLQLPPDFDSGNFQFVESFLRSLPSDLPWSVELRHRSWFDQDRNEMRIDGLLAELEIDKVLFDSRALYQSPPDDEHEKISQTRKPKTPYRETVTAQNPMVRLVGRNRIALAERYLDQWAQVIANWIQSGLRPYIFTHAPDDAYAPAMARLLFDKIQQRIPELNPLPQPPAEPRQTFLFD